MNQNYFFSILLFFISLTVLPQKKQIKFSGKVTANHNILSGVTVYLENTSISTITSEQGIFNLYAPIGTYKLICSSTGYKSQTLVITISEKGLDPININLISSDPINLNEVYVKGKSALQQVKETPFNVVALDVKSQYNTTLDLAHMLDKASGVKIRETGAVGSNMSISLNGFTGKHIKLFMDGVPMEGFGSAFQLNNIPVSIADRIEVYKGVVPIDFGADAMGGVINIVTNQNSNSYIDASYSYGSFNTHKTNLSLGYTSKSGFTVQLNAFQNYSDNNYKVKTSVLNLTTGNYSNEEYWVKRFHDTYHNETIMAKIGFINKTWADRLIFGITLGQEKADIQNANILKVVYGERTRSGSTVLPSISYEKKNLFTRDLNVRFTANYNRNYNQNTDTVARQYNWFGNYIEKKSIGEASYSLAEYYNNNISSTTNLNYRINDNNSFSINNVISNYERKNADQVAVADAESANDYMRRANLKNVLGASYVYRYNDKWNTNIFGKNYFQRTIGPLDISTSAGTTVYEEHTKNFVASGYGLATTYFFKNLQVKASIEKAFRLPTETELFGDEVLETGNTTLKAESTMNYNLGATINRNLRNGNVLYLDTNIYYRDIQDYIRRTVEQRYGTAGYTNHGKVRNIGIDGEARYYYKDRFMIGGNITYQDMRDKEKYEAAGVDRLSVTYNDRIPNVPYFFGNLDTAFYVHNLWGKNNVLSLGYTLNYIGEFFLNWESLGTQSTKATLPEQLYHDFNMSYSIKNGKYNIAFEARNISDAALYDNFSLQKPGRSFSVKLRYFFSKKRTN
jgi:outer membrane receptor protein involved in Fe transport